MKKFIETIKNIFKIEELRKRLVYTFLLILVYRFGCFVVLPGIDASMLANLQSRTQEGLVGLLNMFSGGAFGNASIFALGVMPYISASIVIQLLGVFVPYFRKLQMEGESGRKPDSGRRFRGREPTGLEQLHVQHRLHHHPDGRFDVRDVAR